MGQYYKLVCPEAGTMINSRDLGCGVKALEQIYSFAPPAVLALLSAATQGTHPRDLPWAPKGHWAGRAPLMIGDYANQNAPDGDLLDRDEILPAPEDQLYEFAGEQTGSLATNHRRSKKAKAVSEDFLPVLERACNLRFTDFTQDGQPTGQWRDLIEVAPNASHPSGWEADIEAIEPEHREEVRGYWERTEILKKDNWRRGPLAMPDRDGHEVPTHVPRANEVGQGDALLWVNLDRCEYIDPAVLGDTPDLAGIADGKSPKAVLAMICHHERRGGGDVSDRGPLHLAGRWRGDRIVLMGTAGFKPKSGAKVETAAVRAEFIDVSGNAQAFLLEDDLIGDRGAELDGQITEVQNSTGIFEEITKACFNAPALSARVQSDREGLAAMTLRIVPPLRITHDLDGKKLSTPIELAATVDLRKHEIDGAKVWLPSAAQRVIAAAAAKLPREDVAISKRDRCGVLQNAQIRSVSLAGLSNHGLMDLLAA